MNYFKLFPMVIFMNDVKGGCIVNLINNHKIHYSKEKSDLLSNCLNTSIEDNNQASEIIRDLMYLGYGYIYENNVYQEHHRDFRDLEIRGLAEMPPVFNRIHIETSNTCDFDCSFCSSHAIVNNGCNTCLKWKKQKNSPAISSELRLGFLKRIHNLNVNEYVFSGGNPFIDYGILIESIEAIRTYSKDVKVTIISNGSHINNEIMKFCLKNDVQIIFTLLADSSDKYRKITKCPESYDNLIDSINKCSKNKCFAAILSSGDDILNIQKFAETLNLDVVSIAEIYQGSRFSYLPNFQERKENKVKANEKYNACLFGKFALSIEGDIRPCPRIEESLENIKSDMFEDMFQTQKVDKYWRFTKKSVKCCSNCPYKISCIDCTAVELEINNGNVSGENICDRIGG